MKKSDNKDFLLNLTLFSSSNEQLLTTLRSCLTASSDRSTPLCTIFTPNAEQIVQAHHDPSFAKVLGSADILLPDGAGLVWGYRLLSLFGRARAPQQRISGIDVVQQLLDLGRQQKLKMLIVGGRELATYAQTRSTDGLSLRWVEAYQQASVTTQAEERGIVRIITEWQPDVVFVALGAPYQEFWVAEHAEVLEKAGVRIALVVGGAFDVLAGKLSRAPGWMRTLNLEWLYRLIQEPWRWRRQLRLFEFVQVIIKRALLG